jgi:hypothetical protein
VPTGQQQAKVEGSKEALLKAVAFQLDVMAERLKALEAQVHKLAKGSR